jgi:hypothetical protein
MVRMYLLIVLVIGAAVLWRYLRASQDRARSARVRADLARHARSAAGPVEVFIKPAERPREVRLQEIQDLVAKGLVSADEAAGRRKAILDEV